MAIRYRTKAFERVMRKVEALRMTLPDDEREILDSLIKKNEVEAHKIANKGAKMRTKMAPEVEAHAVTGRANVKQAGRAAKQSAKLKAGK